MPAPTLTTAQPDETASPSLADCPISATIDVIGGKWKPVIVFYLLRRTHRFGELRRQLAGVTQQMLTAQLRELERDGIVHREVYAQVPPKVEYSLTPLGRGLDGVLSEMSAWAQRYLEAVGRTPAKPGPVLEGGSDVSRADAPPGR